MGKTGSFPAWANPVEAVAQHHGVDLKVGLTAEQVKNQRAVYGYNELEKQAGKPLWKLVLEQFDDMLVKVRSGSNDMSGSPFTGDKSPHFHVTCQRSVTPNQAIEGA